MGISNTTQKELGGKDFILKACENISVATTSASADITKVSHGLKIGDIVLFIGVGANTSIAINTYYIVESIVDADNFTITATVGGAAISMDATEASLSMNAFKSFGGIRSKTLAFNSEAIDITNQDSDEWRKILDGAGIRSMDISGSGVYTNEELFQTIFTRARQNLLTGLMFLDTKSFTLFSGDFKLASFEAGGDYNAESSFSLSANSSGEVVRFKFS